MKKQSLNIIMVALVVIIAGACAQAFFFTNFCIVTGTIQFHGRLADRGLPITAYINEDKVTEALTQDNGAFELKIPEFDPAKPDVKGFKSPSDVIQVRLDGKIARPTFSPSSENLKINLQVESTLDVKLSTWGKIKALFK